MFVPFPRDVHPDHVAVALATADALEAWLEAGPGGGTPGASGPRVLCGAIQTPLNPAWATRLAPAGAAWEARRTARRAYVSRSRSIFIMPAVLARLHPARPLRVAEAFTDLSAPEFVRFIRALEAQELTSPGARAGGHALSMTANLLHTRPRRERVTALLRQAVETG